MRRPLYLALAVLAGCSVPDFFLVDSSNGSGDGGQKDAGVDSKPDAAIDAPPGAATVTGVTASNADGYYKANAVISIQVNFSAAVTVGTTGGAPKLSLNTGVSANYTSGSGTTSLTFTYTVAAGNASADLDYTSASALTLNGGTIKNGTVDAFLALAPAGTAGSLGSNKAIVIDAVTPTISAISGTNSFSSSTSASLTYTVTDANPMTTVCNQTTGTGTLANCTATGAMFTGLSEGAHTISITHTDAAGNVSSAQTYSWTVDTTLPVVSAISGVSSFSSSSSASLTYTVTETNQMTTTCTQTAGTGTQGTCSATGVTYTSLSEGAHTVTVTHTDAAGNVSSVKTISWTVDLTDPVISTITGPNNSAAYVSSATGSFTYTITETNQQTTACAFTVGTGTIDTCTATSATVSGLNEGAHTLKVTHTDKAGRIGTKTYSWTVDTVFPVISIAGITNDWTAINSMSTTVTITEANPNTTTCNDPVNSGTQGTCTSTSVSWTNLGPGGHELHVVHTDLAGNQTDQKYVYGYCPPVVYSTQGIPQYTVPSGCGTTMDLQAWGAGGAGGMNGGVGGGGGFARGTMTVAVGQVFIIRVGGFGSAGGGPGFNDGGQGQSGGGGGGGWSGVNDSANNNLLRAAGGGGGGACFNGGAGGAGGGNSGLNGGTGNSGGGTGTGGTQTNGGSPGSGGTPGGQGFGGQGGNSGVNCGGGGGGGGFWGGAGGGGSSSTGGGGGGGGSALMVVPPLTGQLTIAGSGQNAGGMAQPNYVSGHGIGGNAGQAGSDGIVVIHVHP